VASRLQLRPSLGLESQACVSWHRICRCLNGEYVLYLPTEKDSVTIFSSLHVSVCSTAQPSMPTTPYLSVCVNTSELGFPRSAIQEGIGIYQSSIP
jgi:hypothetical protein